MLQLQYFGLKCHDIRNRRIVFRIRNVILWLSIEERVNGIEEKSPAWQSLGTYSAFVRRCRFSRERTRTCLNNSRTNNEALWVKQRKNCHKFSYSMRNRNAICCLNALILWLFYSHNTENGVKRIGGPTAKTVTCYTKPDRIEISINSQ